MSAAPGSIAHIHATALVIGEAGVIVRGASGRGKSALALALIELAAARRLFVRLIGDDRVGISAQGGRILVRGAPNVIGLIEQRGLGLVRVEAEPLAVARLIVDLLDEGARAARLPEEADAAATLAGLRLPRLAFDEASQPLERARTILSALDEGADRFVTKIAHFA